jgi:4-amino-4-deoxy-L-arabinose transferase-like glycosyltransferase
VTRASKRRRPGTPERSAQQRAPTPQAPAGAPAEPRRRGPAWVVASLFLAIAAASCALYWGARDLEFLRIDDPDYVLDNPWIRGFTAENLRRVLSAAYFANYSPLHLISYMLDYEIGGLDPAAYHVSSIVWGGLVAGAVFLFARELTGNLVVGAAAGLLFAAHPAHVEAIAWVSSRKDLVSAFFGLLSFVAYLRCRSSRGSAVWYAAALALFVLGLAGKMSVVILPGVYFLRDVLVERRPFWNSVLDKVPYAVVAAYFHFEVAAAQPPTGEPFALIKFGRAIAECLWLLSGFGTQCLYRNWSLPEPASLAGIGSLAVPAALALGFGLAAWKLPARWSREPLILVALTLFALVPPQILSFEDPVTDRYLFLPSVGVAVLAAWGLVRLAQLPDVRWRILGGLLYAALLAVHAARTLGYLAEWRDPRSVWFAAAEKSNDYQVQLNLGIHYQDLSDQLTLRNAAVVEPSLRLAPLVWDDAARVERLAAELSSSKFDGPETTAFVADLRALALPHLETARELRGAKLEPGIHFRIAKIALDQGRRADAKAGFTRTLEQSNLLSFADRRQELLVRTHQALAVIAWQEQDWDGAAREFRTVDQLQRTFGRSWVGDMSEWIQRAEARRASAQPR